MSRNQPATCLGRWLWPALAIAAACVLSACGSQSSPGATGTPAANTPSVNASSPATTTPPSPTPTPAQTPSPTPTPILSAPPGPPVNLANGDPSFILPLGTPVTYSDEVETWTATVNSVTPAPADEIRDSPSSGDQYVEADITLHCQKSAVGSCFNIILNWKIVAASGSTCPPLGCSLLLTGIGIPGGGWPVAVKEACPEGVSTGQTATFKLPFVIPLNFSGMLEYVPNDTPKMSWAFAV